MNNLTTIYLTILFILPGFLSYSVYKSIYQDVKQESDMVISLKSLLHSGAIYIFCYIAYKIRYNEVYVLGSLHSNQIVKLSDHLLVITLLVALISIVWGLVLVFIASYQPLTLILSFFGIEEQLRPPNIYASIFDPRYNKKIRETGCYIIFPHGGELKAGWIEQADVCGTDRLLWVKGIKVLRPNREVHSAYDDSFTITLDLSKLEWFEISIADVPEKEYRWYKEVINWLVSNIKNRKSSERIKENN